MIMRAESGRGEWVGLSLFAKVCCVSNFRRIKKSYVLCFPVGGDSCSPPSRVSSYSEKSMRVVGLRERFVLTVLRLIRLSKIANSVVQFITVHMVDISFRKRTVDIKPSKPVGKVNLSDNPDLGVPSGVDGPSLSTNRGLRPPVLPVVKKPGVRIVGKKFAQKLCGKIRSSHDDLLYRLDWLEASSCISTSGLRHFTANTTGGKA